jgi:hypothetical protein
MHHHGKYFLEKMRRMRVLFGVAICVVHAVQNSVSPRIEVRRALSNPGKNIKEALPEFIHGEHFMRRITM